MTHTRFTVLDDTQRHPDLAKWISQILRQVAPTVNEITGLPLPAEARFRLLTPRAWRQALRQNHHRMFARDIADLDLTPEEISSVRIGLKIAAFPPVLVWPLVPAATQEAADAQWETVIAPKALRHCGVLADEPSLHQVVAHELVHQMQAEAQSGTVWDSFFPHKRGLLVPPRSMSTVLEGHATWADQQVTTQLLGMPADHHQAPKSWRYRLHNRDIIRRLGPSREAYEQGSRLIAQTVAELGTTLVNQIWKDLTLLPTEEEITDPAAWIYRIERGHARA
ncbi:zinc-dependent metalloprotease [Streptomyces prunicolor]|uniref:zinc-dependent metalloprotease n=1 Tax=Streptomyces prunicolor TaxID=67348 RepID=UPI002255F584|nr:zinc-dependent metalloprotease [Streptomyces prunicolor]MCX5233927.1 zinc-dependent metalloprotease [Streptomyces prunicolor]